MDEQFAPGVEDENVNTAVRQMAGTHLGASRHPHDEAAAIEHVDQFLGGHGFSPVKLLATVK
jgi:hypothetical protein